MTNDENATEHVCSTCGDDAGRRCGTCGREFLCGAVSELCDRPQCGKRVLARRYETDERREEWGGVDEMA